MRKTKATTAAAAAAASNAVAAAASAAVLKAFPATKEDVVNPHSVSIPLPWGRSVEVTDVDNLIAAYARVERVYREAREAKLALANALMANTSGDQRTRYVRGATAQARVEMPDDTYDQTSLKTAWHKYPKFAPEVMTIGYLRILKRGLDRMLRTSGDAEWTAFRELVEGANKGATGTPTITILPLEDKEVPNV